MPDPEAAPIRVVVAGTGQMGSGIARLLLEKRGIELVGAYGRRPERAGTDLGDALGLGRRLGLPIVGDLSALVAESLPQVAIQATCSRLEEALPEVTALVRHGVHVISIAEEMAWPAYRSPEIARRLDGLARERGVVVLGTGINPGFVLDLLVIALSGVCWQVRSITATRVNDLAPYGPSVLRTQGVGLAPEAFRRGVAEGAVVGHVGFPESISMIARAVGFEVERIEERREPIVSRVTRQTRFVTVQPGQTAGCRHTAVAYVGGKPVLTLIHPQQVRPELEGVQTGDTIEIDGTPPVRLAGVPEIPGGLATIALAVNAIPLVLGALPGLRSVADLPVPAALLGDVRALVRGERAGPLGVRRG
jgi:4-hydroxy-tetrahydrodipicolinate reductase